MTTRRHFLAGSLALMGTPRLARGSTPTKKVAFLGTEVRTHSHVQHFLDRMTLGYSWAGAWVAPRLEVASLYIDQFPAGDLPRTRAARHKLTLFPTVEEALTLGGSKLAVDGVVIIAEHGRYPRNEKGQTLYPRYEWFKRVVKVFEASGRSVPVFNDKHLSTTWARCREMVDDRDGSGSRSWRARRFRSPGGSRRSRCRWTPTFVESVCVGYGAVDSYDFHGLETAQCMSERRRGGERGIVRVHALKGRRCGRSWPAGIARRPAGSWSRRSAGVTPCPWRPATRPMLSPSNGRGR